jgi:hypothetical protein
MVRWWDGIGRQPGQETTAIRDILDTGYTDVIPRKRSVLISNPSLQEAFFREALDYFAKGVLTLYSSHILLRDNHRSWALISAYYSSFYTINSLLRIQGRGIVHSSKRKGELFWLVPYQGSKQDFVVKNKREGRGEHLHHWNLFYKLYRRFDSPSANFEPILKEEFFGKEEREESEIRNDKTYRPFSFDEADLRWSENAEAFWTGMNGLDDGLEGRLSALCTDPDHKYFARAGLRLLLAKELIERASPSVPLAPILSEKLGHLFSMRQIMQPSRNVRDQSVGWSIARSLEP